LNFDANINKSVKTSLRYFINVMISCFEKVMIWRCADLKIKYGLKRWTDLRLLSNQNEKNVDFHLVSEYLRSILY